MSQSDIDIARLFDEGEEKALEAYIHLLHPADIAELFGYIPLENWRRVTALLSAEVLAEVLADLDEGQREALGRLLKTERLISVVDELETDDAADVLADLPIEKTEAVLGKLEDAESIRKLLEYADDSAGGIMQTELCRVNHRGRIADAVDAVKKTREVLDDVFEVYVVDDRGALVGQVHLTDLLVGDANTAIGEIAAPVEHKVTPNVDQEEVAQIFRKYDLATLPVVDEEGVLLGRITFDDIHDVLEEEASEDIYTMAGASGEELVYGSDFLRIAMFRIPWLMSSLAGSLLTGSLLTHFSVVPGDALIMAAFVPVVMAMTGNVGTQSAMIVTRGFALGKIESGNLPRTFLREVSVGIIMGVTAGFLVGLAADLWKGDLMLSIALTASIVCSMTIASAIGVAAPTIFKKIGVDPAIAAGPLVTAGCDLLGVSIYLLVAIVVLA